MKTQTKILLFGKKDEYTFTIFTIVEDCYPGSVSGHLVNFFSTLILKLLARFLNQFHLFQLLHSNVSRYENMLTLLKNKANQKSLPPFMLFSYTKVIKFSKSTVSPLKVISEAETKHSFLLTTFSLSQYELK